MVLEVKVDRLELIRLRVCGAMLSWMELGKAFGEDGYQVFGLVATLN